MKHRLNPAAVLVALAVTLFMIVSTKHDESMPVQSCGNVASIRNDGFDVHFKYLEERLPASVSLRFNTDRPDTVVLNQIFCLKK
jgi:hypothetical protein